MKRILRVSIIFFVMTAIVFLFLPDYSKKAFVHQTADIDDYKIFENRTVKAGNHQSWRNSDTYNKKQLSQKAIECLEEYKTVAFFIVQDSLVLHEQYWDDYNDNSHSSIFSATKSIISLLVGIAIDEGKIKSTEQNVSDFIPQFKQGNNNKLKIEHLLNMSADLDWNEAYASPFSSTTKAYYGSDIKTLIISLNVLNEPGKKFSYQSASTQILAIILEKAVGMSISEYASAKLWKPLGAKNNALWSLDKEDGMEKAFCCFSSNAPDIARIGQLILNKGKWKDKQIVSADYIEKISIPASHLKDENNKNIDYYSHHWWILKHKGLTIPYARGILGQYIYVIPEKKAVVVRLGHKRSKEYKNGHSVDTYNFINAALEILE